MNLDNNFLEKVSKLFLLTFPASAKRGTIEVYYEDDFAEFPMYYFDASDQIVEPKFTGWDSTDMVAQSELIALISEVILPLRNNIKKNDDGFWNIFKLHLDNKENKTHFEFLYSKEKNIANEAETREAIGDELYEKFEEERKNFKETKEEPAISIETLSTGQLLGIIKDNLSEAIPDAWDSLILKTTIEEDENQSIETHFFYQLGDKEIQFEPENPITSMNALLKIQERMAEEGNDWNKSIIIINRDGTVDIQLK